MTPRKPSARAQRRALLDAMKAIGDAVELIGVAGVYFNATTGSADSDVAEDKLEEIMGKLGDAGPLALMLAGIIVRYVDPDDVIEFTVGQSASLLGGIEDETP